jgi:hypothetical protein
LFIAEQIDALPESIEDYLAAERNRQRHVAELQDRFGFRPFGTRPDLAGWLLPHAIENDRLAHLAGLVVEECRRRRIVVPSPGALVRIKAPIGTAKPCFLRATIKAAAHASSGNA